MIRKVETYYIISVQIFKSIKIKTGFRELKISWLHTISPQFNGAVSDKDGTYCILNN